MLPVAAVNAPVDQSLDSRMFLTGCYLKSYLTMNLPFVFSSFTKGSRRMLSEDAETIVAHLRLL